MSVKWVQALLNGAEVKLNATHDLPFWDAQDEDRPFFMQVVLPYQNQRWDDLQKVALKWTAKEPNSAEAWYYLGASYATNEKLAKNAYEKALSLKPNHPVSLQALALLANKQGNQAEFEKMRLALKTLDDSLAESLDATVKAEGAAATP